MEATGVPPAAAGGVHAAATSTTAPPARTASADGAPVTAPASLRTLSVPVEARLEALFDHEIARWAALDTDLVPPLEALAALVLSGGKRLRPAFCHWGWVAAGGDPDDGAVVDAGAAFELLQAFALVHDDVMDGSATRRGAPAVHLAFAERHRAEAWRGEDRRFGEGVAILVGDLLHVYADQLMGGAPPPALEVWDELRIELNVGQYLDLIGTARRDTDDLRARRIARYKSGKYTIERPLHLGAALAGRYPDLAPALSGYGLPLGEAFQLRDDVLGAFGEARVTGKPVGDDLREGKPTPLLAIATQRATAAQHEVLDQVGRRDLDGDEVAALQQVLVQTEALATVEADIVRLRDEAIAAVRRAPIDGTATDELVALARYVAARER
jgi:geranylgeranyl diphosphate synthase type I